MKLNRKRWRKLKKGEHRYITRSGKVKIYKPKNYKKWKQNKLYIKKGKQHHLWVFKPKPKNIAYTVVGGFDITDLKGYEGRNMFLEVSIEIIKPKTYNIDNAIIEISNFIQQWFIDHFGFNPANISGHKNKSVVSKFNIGVDSEISTDQNEQINILQLDFNKPLHREALKRDLESFLNTL